MARSAELQKLIQDRTGEIFSFLSDYFLWQLLFWLEFPTAGRGSRNVYEASERAAEEFFKIKDKRAEAAVVNLRSQGYIRFTKGGSDPEITRKGFDRLRRKLPVYEEKRPWNGKLYLVTYDIPTERNALRNRLRRMIGKLGGAMLQASIWVVPYDPRAPLKQFIDRNGLHGLVIVSEIGKDGAIGGETFESLVWKVYRLEDINRRYARLIEKAANKNSRALTLKYLSILKDDPQLPFELLPKCWEGDAAYKLCWKPLQKLYK